MTEESKKIVLPAYLIRRCEAFRIVKGDQTSYLLRDKLHGKTYDFDPWQFFILEVLPGCETLEKLQGVFKDRFDRDISKQELDELFASIADKKLFDESALQHPLLQAFARRTYDVIDGKAVLKEHVENVNKIGAAAKDSKSEPVTPLKDLPVGVQDAIGADPRTMRKMFDIFDPRPILKVIAPRLAPLRYLGFALPALLLLALILVGQHWEFLLQDLRRLHIEMSLGAHLLFSLLTVNLTATIFRSCLAYMFGAQVEQFGIIFFVGFIPRFEIGIRGLDDLSRRKRMWFHGANLLLRLFILSCAVLVWWNTRTNLDGIVHEGALAFILTCWGSLVIETGNPFMRASTYYLLCAFLDEPHLRGKAHKALTNKLRGGVYQSADSNILAIYALACATYVSLLIIFLTLGLGGYLLQQFHLGGFAVVLTIAICTYLLWRNYTTLKKYSDSYERTMQFDRWRKRTLLAAGQVEGEVVTKKSSYWIPALFICLLLVLLLPYPYQPSGSFTIYPTRKQVMSTDTPGLIDEVYFDGGESVKKGTPLARLAHDDYLAQIKVLTGKIDQQKATVDNLKTLPKPEQVKLAEALLEVQRTHEAFSREKVPRLEKLYHVGAVSFEEYDTARKEHEVDVQQVVQKQAELALVKVPVTSDEIAAAEAQLVALKEERADFEAKVARTVIRMPFDGNILTLHLMDRTNSYLDKGQPFASIEYTGTVTAQIDIAEPDLQYITLGNSVHVRPNAFFNREFVGKVTLIDRNVTVKPTGTFVNVIATIDNPNGLLKTDMSGEAKIDTVTIPVWEAFTQTLIRFFQVQVWSWIP
jgi:putative peptide zinc metalloprotease protein